MKSAKTEPAKVEPVKAASAKAEAIKPIATHVASDKPEIRTEAKPVKVDAKADAKTPAKPASKGAIPALRQTATAY